jgi:cation:H+ antiporter
MPAAVIFFIGLIILTIGAELLLRGASRIASLLKIRPIVIGLTVVSIGTSLPELAVGVTAISDGAEDMAVGNIAGTNLVNILLILGLSAAIKPLTFQIKAVKFEMLVMVFTAFLLLILCLDGLLSYWDGILMLGIGIIYVVLIIRKSQKENINIQIEYDIEYQLGQVERRKKIGIWIKNSLLLIVGIAGTIWGADLLVSGAISIAKVLGISDAVIGLTIIAIGTSAPELATTIVATYKDERDVAVGNLLGSSTTNILVILSITTLLVPDGIQVNKNILWFDLPLAALVALVCYPVFKSDQKLSRVEGMIFASSYVVYLVFLLYFRK